MDILKNNWCIILLSIVFLLAIIIKKPQKRSTVNQDGYYAGRLNLLIQQYNSSISQAELIFDNASEMVQRHRDLESMKKLDAAIEKFMMLSPSCAGQIEQMRVCTKDHFDTMEYEVRDHLTEMDMLLSLAQTLEQSSADYTIDTDWGKEETQKAVPENITEFFSGCNDKESLDKRYRALVKAFHPDNECGDMVSFCRLQKEYELKRAKIKQRGEAT